MNEFDRALSYYDDDGLGGLGSKLKKAVKKVKKGLSKVNKARKKIKKTIRKKTMPDKVEKAVKKIERSPIVKAVAIGVGTFFAGPAVLAAISAMSPAAGALVAKSGLLAAKGTLAATVKSAAIKGAVQQAGQQGARRYTKKKTVKMKREAQKVAHAAEQEQIKAQFREISTDPAFVKHAMTQYNAGNSLEQIMNSWVESDTYKNMARYNVGAAVYPTVRDEIAVSAQGLMSQQQIDDTAAAVSDDIARNSVSDIQAQSKSIIPLLIAAVPVALLLAKR